jgi:small GTP-binding protein
MINIIVVGKSGVGKTSLIKKFVEGSFQERHDQTIGMTFSMKQVLLEGLPYMLQIWDTAASEQYMRQINQQYVKTFWKKISGIIIMTDIHDSDSS